jgi:hypothetical protein
LSSAVGGSGCQFFQAVDEMTTRSVGAESNRVVRFTEVGLVLGMSVDCPQLLESVSELAFLAVLARTVFLVRSTQLRLVSARVDLGRRQRSR